MKLQQHFDFQRFLLSCFLQSLRCEALIISGVLLGLPLSQTFSCKDGKKWPWLGLENGLA